jgi:hypothetical protein
MCNLLIFVVWKLSSIFFSVNQIGTLEKVLWTSAWNKPPKLCAAFM